MGPSLHERLISVTPNTPAFEHDADPDNGFEHDEDSSSSSIVKDETVFSFCSSLIEDNNVCGCLFITNEGNFYNYYYISEKNLT